MCLTIPHCHPIHWRMLWRVLRWLLLKFNGLYITVLDSSIFFMIFSTFIWWTVTSDLLSIINLESHKISILLTRKYTVDLYLFQNMSELWWYSNIGSYITVHDFAFHWKLCSKRTFMFRVSFWIHHKHTIELWYIP